MLTSGEIEKLEKRALGGLSGYTSDVNITCYVYGRDVLALLNDRREILVELDTLKCLSGEKVPDPMSQTVMAPEMEVLQEVAVAPDKKGRASRDSASAKG